MNKYADARLMDLADALALGIQEVRSRGQLRSDEALLNMDYADRALAAPFVFDMALGRLHRNGCKAIPESSLATLYAVGSLRDGDEKLACEICRPEPIDAAPAEPEEVTDVFFGAISFLDQFSGILRERGREYRKTTRAKDLVQQVETALMQIARGNASQNGEAKNAGVRIRLGS